ncbi:MAG: pyruvate ferredoxin oxidoreductase [Planctomycetes bacterium]|jgi:indolepyruvate ferredoxin oxidoreductase beta subunit|nr:pyruvate ferredoxin oxidoreductase [Planctomycetota bacterium]
MTGKVINVVVAGLGGQGVLTAADIVAAAAFNAGLDVKKSEVHGMSQRGGSVACDVRFGQGVYSPMVTPGEADFLVVLSADQVDVNRRFIKPGGAIITPDDIDENLLADKRGLNVALMAALSRRLDIDESHWIAAIKASLNPRLHEANVRMFQAIRAAE